MLDSHPKKDALERAKQMEMMNLAREVRGAWKRKTGPGHKLFFKDGVVCGIILDWVGFCSASVCMGHG